MSQWADQSGNARNFNQATGAAQPTLQGDTTIVWDGSSDFMATAGFVIAQPFTLYMRIKQVSWTANDVLSDTAGGGAAQIYQQTASPRLTVFGGVDGPTSTALAVGSWGSLAAVWNGASSVLQVGADTQTGNPGANGLNGLTIGAANGGSGFGNIQLAEVILYSAAHDATQRAAVIAYLDTL